MRNALVQSHPALPCQLVSTWTGNPLGSSWKRMGVDESQRTLGQQLTLSHLGLFDQTWVLDASQGHGVSWRGSGGWYTHAAPLAESRNWAAGELQRASQMSVTSGLQWLHIQQSPPLLKPIHQQTHHAVLPQPDKNQAEIVSLAAYPQFLLLPWMAQDQEVPTCSHLWIPLSQDHPAARGHQWEVLCKAEEKEKLWIPKNFPGTRTGSRECAVQEVTELRRTPSRFLVSPVARRGEC